MKALRVTENTAGMESTAKIKSVVSTNNSAKASGVSAKRPLNRVKNFWPSKFCVTGKSFCARRSTRFFSGWTVSCPGKKHFDAGENQKRAENVKHPIELVNERRAEGNHRAAHQQRAENAPKQQPMLKFRRHAKPREDERDDENVVQRQ